MRIIDMNGRDWRSKEDFYEALADALGGFEGHGRNAEAFLETMIFYPDLNSVQPPYEVTVREADEAMQPFLTEFASWVEAARTDRKSDPDWGDDVDVTVIVS